MLGILFGQYSKDRRACFGSRLLKHLGNTFMGTPDSKGMQGYREDIKHSFYYVRADRYMPSDSKGLHQWQDQSLFVNEFRDVEAPQIAKDMGKIGLVFAIACVALAVPVQKAKVAWDKAHAEENRKEQAEEAKEKEAKEKADRLAKFVMPKTYAGCEALYMELANGTKSLEDIPNEPSVRTQCQQMRGVR